MGFYSAPESKTMLVFLFVTSNGLNDEAIINGKIYKSFSIMHLGQIKN